MISSNPLKFYIEINKKENRVSKEKRRTYWLCPDCNTKNKAWNHYCQKCNHKLKSRIY